MNSEVGSLVVTRWRLRRPHGRRRGDHRRVGLHAGGLREDAVLEQRAAHEGRVTQVLLVADHHVVAVGLGQDRLDARRFPRGVRVEVEQLEVLGLDVVHSDQGHEGVGHRGGADEACERDNLACAAVEVVPVGVGAHVGSSAASMPPLVSPGKTSSETRFGVSLGSRLVSG